MRREVTVGKGLIHGGRSANMFHLLRCVSVFFCCVAPDVDLVPSHCFIVKCVCGGGGEQQHDSDSVIVGEYAGN